MVRLSITLLSSLLLGAYAFGALAQEPPKSPRDRFIVGGQKATDIAELPWQVALIVGNRPEPARDQFCGGSIIDSKWILTAAHCVDNPLVFKDAARVDVVAGTLTYATGGERVDAETIIVHPNWNSGTFDFDAALIKLKAPLKMGTAIPVAVSGADVPAGFDVRVSGWGATIESGSGSPDLLFVDLPAVSNDDCNKPEAYGGDITSQMLCAGKDEGGMDSCQGDSGGPAAAKLGESFSLVGIVSWGIGCARPLKYGVYTRVTTISDWATQTMQSN